MAFVNNPAGALSLGGSALGNTLKEMLKFGDLIPGDDPSYAVCKSIMLYHPLGWKLVAGPTILAQSQPREISVPTGPETRLVEAFLEQWDALACDNLILGTMAQARGYGITSVGLLEENVDPGEPLDLKKLATATITFNIWDPLNTAGSLYMNQDPNALDFQKHKDIVINGKRYHRSRTRTMMNEPSIYIAWTTSAFGFTGRSVYQRSFFPLKSYLQTMITNDMVSLKAGVLIAKMVTPGSIVDKLMMGLRSVKQTLLNNANVVDRNILSIGVEEDISSLNLQNIDRALGAARDNIIKDIAVASGEPAKLLTEEAYVQGFGEGSEDARAIAHRIDRHRIELEPLYKYFDRICMHRAWNEEFWKSVREELDDEDPAKASYEAAFYSWKKAFSAPWPSLLTEPDSEKAKVEETKFKSVVAVVQTFGPLLDPDNRARLMDWAMQNVNNSEFLFPGAQVEFDPQQYLDFAEKEQEQQEQQGAGGGMGGGMGDLGEEPAPKEPKAAPPFSMRDSVRRGKVKVGGQYIPLDGIDEDRKAELFRILQGGKG